MKTSHVRPWSEVSLRPLDEVSKGKFKVWQNDPYLRRSRMGFRFPVNASKIDAWLEEQANQNGKRTASFSIFFGDEAVGACSLDDIDWINRTTKFGIYIAEPDVKGRGAGYCACILALDFAFSVINLRRVELDVLETNHAAVSLYEKIGFVQEGVARQAIFLGGKTEDVVRFGLLSEEFKMDLPPEANRLI